MVSQPVSQLCAVRWSVSRSVSCVQSVGQSACQLDVSSPLDSQDGMGIGAVSGSDRKGRSAALCCLSFDCDSYTHITMPTLSVVYYLFVG